MEASVPAKVRKGDELLLSELYVSVQGESSLVGIPTIFVRLYTCNLRCAWCDSMHAVEGGAYARASIDEVTAKVLELAGPYRYPTEGIRNLCWTGGEPLLQAKGIARVIHGLPEAFLHSIETDGEIDVRKMDDLVPEERAAGQVRYVMDVKCPGSGMEADKAFGNLGRLLPHDEVKYVIRDRKDYDFAKEVLTSYATRANTVLFSPATAAHTLSKGLEADLLAGWILEDRLPVRLQLQVHKLIWPGRDRGI